MKLLSAIPYIVLVPIAVLMALAPFGATAHPILDFGFWIRAQSKIQNPKSKIIHRPIMP